MTVVDHLVPRNNKPRYDHHKDSDRTQLMPYKNNLRTW